MANNSDDFVYFVLIDPTKRSYGFATYSDNKGDVRMIESKKDMNGRSIPRRWKFTQSQRTIRVHNSKVDQIKFLREHPHCKDSPNAVENSNPVFKEMNAAQDAKIGLDAASKVVNAQTLALNLTGQDLKAVGALCGTFYDEELQLKFHVMNYAKVDPDQFVSHYNSVIKKGGDGKIRALIRKGLKADIGVLTQKGTVIYWKEEMLGTDEDEAVAKIAKTKGMQAALTKAING